MSEKETAEEVEMRMRWLVEDRDKELDRLREENEELKLATLRTGNAVKEVKRLHRIEEAARAHCDGEIPMGALRAVLDERDVPRVTDAERAEALRVREGLE